MKTFDLIKRLSGDKCLLLGLILGAGLGFIGGELTYFVHYLFDKVIILDVFLLNLIWGIIIVCFFFYLIYLLKKKETRKKIK